MRASIKLTPRLLCSLMAAGLFAAGAVAWAQTRESGAVKAPSLNEADAAAESFMTPVPRRPEYEQIPQEPPEFTFRDGVLRDSECCPVGGPDNPFQIQNFYVGNVVRVYEPQMLNSFDVELMCDSFFQSCPVTANVTFMVYRRDCDGQYRPVVIRVRQLSITEGWHYYNSGILNLQLTPTVDCNGNPVTTFYSFGVGVSTPPITPGRDSDVYPQDFCGVGYITGSWSISGVPPPPGDTQARPMGPNVQSGVWSMRYCFQSPPGACCLPDDTCQMFDNKADCEALGGSFTAASVSCSDIECPLPKGACCYGLETCEYVNEYRCDDLIGTWTQDQHCTPFNPCRYVGACCQVDGSCDDEMTFDECTALDGVYEGDHTQCPTVSCTPRGACCLVGGTCEVRVESNCTPVDGEYQGDGTHCEPIAPCDTTLGACCYYDGSCARVTEYECANNPTGTAGTWTAGASCPAVECPVLGACCNGTTCTGDMSSNACQYVWYEGKPCEYGPCLDEGRLGACCVLGDCEITTEIGCSDLGGVWGGDAGASGFEACSIGIYPDACSSTANQGACCQTGPTGPFCDIMTEAECQATATGSYAGDGIACSGIVCAEWACCLQGVPPADSCVNALTEECIDIYQGTSLSGDVCHPSGVNPCQPSGACCFADGTCDVMNDYQCDNAGGIYQGDDVDCDTAQCPLIGACCYEGGQCDVLTDLECALLNGDFAGAETQCVPDACAFGACCELDGTCIDQLGAACAMNTNGEFLGDATSCGLDCIAKGACCLPVGSNGLFDCELRTEHDCTTNGGVYAGDGVECGVDTCEVAACCLPSGGCVDMLPTQCLATNGLAAEAGRLCSSGDLCTPGACCVDLGGTAVDLSCLTKNQLACEQDSRYYNFNGAGTTCNSTICKVGACCQVTGDCIDDNGMGVSQSECEAFAGAEYFPKEKCVEGLCGPPVGLCCRLDGTCEDGGGAGLEEADCSQWGGAEFVPGEFCATWICTDKCAAYPGIPPGDFDGDGDTDLADFAEFQVCFGNSPSDECLCVFDTNEDGVIDLVDFETFQAIMYGPGVTSGPCDPWAAYAAADFDNDSHVDLKDFAAFSICASYPAGEAPYVCTCIFDDNGDAVIDAADLPAFVAVMAGPAP